jgi:hypothetical protein
VQVTTKMFLAEDDHMLEEVPPDGPDHALGVPSLRSSPWIRGAPQSGLARAISWIKTLSSEPIGGRPDTSMADRPVASGELACAE